MYKKKKYLKIIVLVLIVFLFINQNILAANKYNWAEFKAKYIKLIKNKDVTSVQKFLTILPKDRVDYQKTNKDIIDFVFAPDNFSQFEKVVERGSIRTFNILFRLKYLTDGAYSEQLDILTGSLIKKNPKNFLLAVDESFEHIKTLDSILCNLGPQYVDKFKKQNAELEKRYNVLKNVESKKVSKAIKQLCLCKLESHMKDVERVLRQIEKQQNN